VAGRIGATDHRVRRWSPYRDWKPKSPSTARKQGGGHVSPEKLAAFEVLLTVSPSETGIPESSPLGELALKLAGMKDARVLVLAATVTGGLGLRAGCCAGRHGPYCAHQGGHKHGVAHAKTRRTAGRATGRGRRFHKLRIICAG